MEIWAAITGLIGAVAVAVISRYPAARRDDRLRDSIAKDIELLEKLDDAELHAQHKAHVARRLSELRDVRERRTPVSDSLMTLGGATLTVAFLLWIVLLLMTGEPAEAKKTVASLLAVVTLLGFVVGLLLTTAVYCWQAFAWSRRAWDWLTHLTARRREEPEPEFPPQEPALT